MLRESQTRRLKKKASASSSPSSGLPGYKTALASALASFVLVYYFFHVTQFQVNDSTSIFQRCDYTLSKDFDWNATYEAPCWKDVGLRKEEWKDEPEKAVQILKKEGAVFLQGVLNQQDVDIARPHLARKHMMRSRNRTFLESPYAILKDPKGRYELFGNLDAEAEREMVNKIMGSISGILDRIVGSDGRLTEFGYVTQCKCGMQKPHKDVCSYYASDGNKDDYCTEFYSLFVPLQHTPFEMGGTQFWRGTHNTKIGDLGGNLDEPLQGQFNAGDAMLYNQRLVHRGAINALYKSRIMTVLVFSSNGKGGPGLDRNFLVGDLENYKKVQTLGAQREYMYAKYFPEGGERCRVQCPKSESEWPKDNEVQAVLKDRIIKRNYYYTGKIKVKDFPIRDTQHLQDILSSFHDEI